LHKAVLTTFAATLLSAGLATGPALAQGGATQTPPAPNSGQSAPEPSNSIPSGGATMSPGAPPTGVVGDTAVGGSPSASPSGAGQNAPAAPSGSSGGQPSGAFDKTIPQPASK